METQCNGMLFDFQGQNRRDVVAPFDGGIITTDGGALLLREVERLTGIIADFSACFLGRMPMPQEEDMAETAMQHLECFFLYPACFLPIMTPRICRHY